MLYLWAKALHIIAVISWMAALLYLPRLMVYHTGAEKGSFQSETFKVMEWRLLRIIGTPALVVSWVLGLYMVFSAGLLASGALWMHFKLILVIILSLFHMRLAWHVKQFALDKNWHSERYFRLLNEAPTVLMVGIVLLVVLKPF